MRQDQKGMLVGIYETNPQHWSMDGAPWDYGVELLQENIDRISGELELVHRRYPVLETAGIRKWVNGAFTFSPDGNPLVGPIAGKPRLLAGLRRDGRIPARRRRRQGAGGMDDSWRARRGCVPLSISPATAPHTSNREYIRQTTGEFYARRFVMTYPNEQLPAGRPLKTTPAYDAMSAAGCQWGNSWGLKFRSTSPAGFRRNPRSNARTLSTSSAPNAAPYAKTSASSISLRSRATRSPDQRPSSGSIR